MSSDVRVTPRDITKAGLCMTGAREWTALHQFDYSVLLREGLPVEDVRAVDCPLGNRACDEAEKRMAGAD